MLGIGSCIYWTNLLFISEGKISSDKKMIAWLGIIAIVGLLSIILAIGLFIYDSVKRAKVHGLIVDKLKENRSISDSELRAFLVTQGVNMPPDELSLRRTYIETSLDELLGKRERALQTIVALEVIGSFFYLVLGIIGLWEFGILNKLAGPTEILGIPLNVLITLFGLLGLISWVLSILGFGLAFKFWGSKDSPWTVGLVHACVCLAMGVFTLPIGIFSILIYVAIIYCLTRSDVKDLSKAFIVPVKEEVYMPTSTIYQKLVDLYSEIYGFPGKRKLDRKIETYIDKGFTQEEAIQKVAKEEGYK